MTAEPDIEAEEWPDKMYVPQPKDFVRGSWVLEAGEYESAITDDVENFPPGYTILSDRKDGARITDSERACRDSERGRAKAIRRLRSECGTAGCLVGWIGLLTEAKICRPEGMGDPRPSRFMRMLITELGYESLPKNSPSATAWDLSSRYEEGTWTAQQMSDAFARVIENLGYTEDA